MARNGDNFLYNKKSPLYAEDVDRNMAEEYTRMVTKTDTKGKKKQDSEIGRLGKL